MQGIKIRLEFIVDMEILKKVLKERGLTVNMTNMKRIATIYKERQYTVKDKTFFDDFPRDRETLLMYGFTFEKRRIV